jgi:hypothetical protein
MDNTIAKFGCMTSPLLIIDISFFSGDRTRTCTLYFVWMEMDTKRT